MATLTNTQYSQAVAVIASQIAQAADDTSGNAIASRILNVAHVLAQPQSIGQSSVEPVPLGPAPLPPRIPPLVPRDGDSPSGDPSGGTVPVAGHGPPTTPSAPIPTPTNPAPSQNLGNIGTPAPAPGVGGDIGAAAADVNAALGYLNQLNLSWIPAVATQLEQALQSAEFVDPGDTWFPDPNKTIVCTRNFRTTSALVLPQIKALAKQLVATNLTAAERATLTQRLKTATDDFSLTILAYMKCLTKLHPIS